MRTWCAVALVGLLSAGCAPGVKGTWVGKVECDAFAWNVQLDLDKVDKLAFEGTGEQARSFDNASGFPTTTTIAFDIEGELVEPTGVQNLEVSFTCTSNTTVVQRPDGDEDTSEGCDQSRYEDYTLRWDGEDLLQLKSDEQNCEGKLARRGA